MAQEFDLIDTYLKPLTGLCAESRALLDDVAVLGADADHDLVVSTDAMVAGVHFFADDPYDRVAQKLLRSNLSDIYAKGARPYGYQLMTCWPKGMDDGLIADFVKGLRQDQALYGIDLFGGDTVSTDGHLVLSVTIFGKAPKGRTLSRVGARDGDIVMVGGAIGDAYLGLQLRLGAYEVMDIPSRAALLSAYHRPELKPHQAKAVLDFATASMDISDGLVADCDHLARVNGLKITLDLDRMPTSQAARAAIAMGARPLNLATGGDDYQILCTARPDNVAALENAGFTVIGSCQKAEGDAYTEVTSFGRVLEVAKRGFVHF